MKAIGILVLAAALSGYSGAAALYGTPQSFTSGNSPVSAEVEFSITGATLEIVLTNYVADESKSHEAISGIAFDLIGARIGSVPVVRVTGKQGVVNNKRTLTDITELSGATDLWTLTALVRGLTYSVSSWPKYAILADPGPSNRYSGKGGIGGTGHEPFIIGPATISLEFESLSPLARISNVEIDFGHARSVEAVYQSGDVVPASGVPEPSTVASAGAGLIVLACAARLTKRRKMRAR